MHGDERGVDRRRRRPFRRFVFFRLKSEKTVTFSFFNLFFFPSSSSSSSHRRRTQKMAALALFPFAPLLALPPRLVAAAASCACLLGGAALGVARVRAGEPRAAEVATATFAAVGATLAVSAWWLLASGGVGTVRGGNGGGDERGKGKWRREAVRGAVNNNNSGNNNNGTGASPSSSSSSSSSASSSSRRPLALAARFASVPWKAAQRASRAGNALCPFTGRSFFFEGGERKRGGKTAVPFPFFFLVLTSRECPLDQNNNNKTNTGERASLRCPCCRATVSRNAWHSGDKFCGLGLGGGPLLWQPAEAALEKVKKKSSSFFRARRKGTLFFFLSFFSFVSQNQRFSFFSPLLHTPQKNNRTTPRWRTESSSTRPWTSRGTFCSVSVFFFFFFFFLSQEKPHEKNEKLSLSLISQKTKKKLLLFSRRLPLLHRLRPGPQDHQSPPAPRGHVRLRRPRPRARPLGPWRIPQAARRRGRGRVGGLPRDGDGAVFGPVVRGAVRCVAGARRGSRGHFRRELRVLQVWRRGRGKWRRRRLVGDVFCQPSAAAAADPWPLQALSCADLAGRRPQMEGRHRRRKREREAAREGDQGDRDADGRSRSRGNGGGRDGSGGVFFDHQLICLFFFSDSIRSVFLVCNSNSLFFFFRVYRNGKSRAEKRENKREEKKKDSGVFSAKQQTAPAATKPGKRERKKHQHKFKFPL